jgi:hypothetical protein
MTQRKHLKRLVRERMEKTGESYVTALGYVRGQPPLPFREPTPAERALERQVAALCARLGCSVTRSPSVPGEWAAPALLVAPAVGAPCYADVAVAGDDARVMSAADIPELAREVEALVVNASARFFAGSPKLAFIGRAPRPTSPVAAAVARAADRLVDPDLPYVVAISAASDVEAGIIEAWAGHGGPRLHVSAVLVVTDAEPLLYHHPEPRRPLTATPLLRLPQAVWVRGRYDVAFRAPRRG